MMHTANSSLIKARDFLMSKLGDYGRTRFEWLKQKYNVGLNDELPEEMKREVYSYGNL